MQLEKFKKIIWDYYKKHGRHNLPWRKTKDPYKILVSEYMLQQTQVGRVIPKYKLFIKKFPTLKKLAGAQTSEVLKSWQGLGYNRRALYLKRTAEIITRTYGDIVPKDPNILVTFPGIGKNTAGAISAYSFNLPVVFIETNIRRIFIHFFFNKKKKIHDDEILKLIHKTMDKKNPREWYFALMDYGAYLPKHIENPNRRSKHYVKQSKFKGSDRELRGKILRLLLKNNSISEKKISNETKESQKRIKKVLKTLIGDGFVKIKQRKIVLVK